MPGIGDDKADVEIVSGGGELPDEIFPRDIKHDDLITQLRPVIGLGQRTGRDALVRRQERREVQAFACFFFVAN